MKRILDNPLPLAGTITALLVAGSLWLLGQNPAPVQVAPPAPVPTFATAPTLSSAPAPIPLEPEGLFARPEPPPYKQWHHDFLVRDAKAAAREKQEAAAQSQTNPAPTFDTSSPNTTDASSFSPSRHQLEIPAPSGTRTGAICRDGWASDATGRGACSHHGGVDHWTY